MRLDKDDTLFVGLVYGNKGRTWTQERREVETMEVGDVMHGATPAHYKATRNVHQLRDGRKFLSVTHNGEMHIKRIS